MRVGFDHRVRTVPADHIVAGVEFLPSEDSKITLEGFYKMYNDYPFSVNDSISLANKGGDFGTVGDEEVVSIGEGRAYNMNFYLIAGLGSTSFADDDRFTVNFGAGFRFLLTDSVAIHADFRDHLFDNDILGREKTTHNLEGTIGVSVFF